MNGGCYAPNPCGGSGHVSLGAAIYTICGIAVLVLLVYGPTWYSNWKRQQDVINKLLQEEDEADN